MHFHGETSVRWIVQRRLNKPQSMLKADVSASDTYMKVGFKKLSHFSTAFKNSSEFDRFKYRLAEITLRGRSLYIVRASYFEIRAT